LARLSPTHSRCSDISHHLLLAACALGPAGFAERDVAECSAGPSSGFPDHALIDCMRVRSIGTGLYNKLHLRRGSNFSLFKKLGELLTDKESGITETYPAI